jgi:hypothetical protein
MIDALEKHPLYVGILSASSSVGFSIIGVLSQESTVRLLGSVGAIFGIILSGLSIVISIKKMIKKQ